MDLLKTTEKKQNIFICAAIIVSILFAYGKVTTSDFINIDDDVYVTNNWHVRQGLTKDNIYWAATSTVAALWHPVTLISYMIDFELYGMNPGGYHFTNLLIHIFNSVLCFFVFNKMTKYRWGSVLTAFLFAVHPLRVESVAWIAERKDVLSTFFLLIAIFNYILYVKNQSRSSYLALILSFLLAGMSKPMVVTLPFVLLLLDYWPLQRFSQKSADGIIERIYSLKLYEKIPLFIISGILCIVTIIAHENSRGLGTVYDYSIKTRLETSLYSYLKYIYYIFFPCNLGILYPYQKNILSRDVLIAGILLISISYLSIKFRYKKPYILVGWFWYICTLIPVIGLLKIGHHSIADRYTYIPSIGIYIILSWTLGDIASRLRSIKRYVITASVVVYVSLLMIQTRKQVSLWENSIKIFEHTLKITNNNYLIHNSLGVAFAQLNRKGTAADHYKKSINANINYEFPYVNYGLLLLSDKKTENEGIAYYKNIVNKRPDFVLVQYQLSLALLRFKRLDEAYINFIDVLRKKTDFAEAYYYLGGIMSLKGDKEKAKFFFKKALSINPYVIHENR